jgi:hypothetical protein
VCSVDHEHELGNAFTVFTMECSFGSFLNVVFEHIASDYGQRFHYNR